MATIVTGDLYHKIDGQLLEIKQQLRQHEGYPYKPKDLQKALQEVIEGRIVPLPVDHRFGIVLMSEPIVIPQIDITACIEKCRCSVMPGTDSMHGWEYFQPSEPLRPGSEGRFFVYITREHVSEAECIQFIKHQGGVLPNLHGLLIALEKDLLPKNNTCAIFALDEKEHLAPAYEHQRVVPKMLCIEKGRKDMVPGNTLQWQFWGAGVDKGKCIMFFKQ